MSESTESISNEREELGVDPPKAIVHKKILDVAESRPEASIEAITDAVSGANATLVKQVLDEYGDPGAASEGDDGTDESVVTAMDDTTMSTSQQIDDPVPDPEELTKKQQETVRLIAERPEATQTDIAEELGVTSSTISQRVNAIDGFDWSNRHEIVDTMLENGDMTAGSREAEPKEDTTDGASESNQRVETTDPTPDSSRDGEVARDDPDGDGDETIGNDGSPLLAERIDDLAEQLESIEQQLNEAADAESNDTADPNDGNPALAERIDGLAEQLESIEQQLEANERPGGTPGVSNDPELAHKVVHACFDSETVTEDEELRILKTMMQSDG